MADIQIKAEGVDELRKALGIARKDVRTYARTGTEEVAEMLVVAGERNLANREGGGKYARGVAEIVVIDDGEGVELRTPWLGMEFGGHVTQVFRNRIGTDRADEIGLERMWAPWHKTSTRGYIIGQASHALTDSGRLDEAVADAVLAGIVAAMDEAGVPT